MDVRFLQRVVLSSCLVPLGLLGWDAAHGDLGANPIELVTRATGALTLVFLTLSLAVTPARQLLGLPWLHRLRRTFGLLAYLHLCLHLTTYLWLDKFFDLRAILDDVLSRPFITFGMLAFVLVTPLAWTSTNKAIKRLGARRWNRIHRRVYAVAVLAVVHYWLEVKADISRPLAFAVALGVLLLYRLVVYRPAGVADVKPRR